MLTRSYAAKTETFKAPARARSLAEKSGPTGHKVQTKPQLTISFRNAGMPGTAVPIKVRPTLTKAVRCIRRRSLAMR